MSNFKIKAVAVASILASIFMFGPAANAAPPLTGTISLSEAVSFGDTVVYDTTVTGKVPNRSIVQITTVCSDASGIVFQQSAMPGYPVTFAGNSIIPWNNTEAQCEARLFSRDQYKGTITVLDSYTFHVSAV